MITRVRVRVRVTGTVTITIAILIITIIEIVKVVIIIILIIGIIIIGIRLPNDNEARISQFADDTTIITNSSESFKSHLQTIEVFGAISGLKLNRKKTKAMWLGSMKHNTCKILEFNSTREPVKVLGIFLSYNQDEKLMKISLAELGK